MHASAALLQGPSRADSPVMDWTILHRSARDSTLHPVTLRRRTFSDGVQQDWTDPLAVARRISVYFSEMGTFSVGESRWTSTNNVDESGVTRFRRSVDNHTDPSIQVVRKKEGEETE
jgi:hypothetical protein